MKQNEKQYLADGVYITYDGYGWWLTTDRGRLDGVDDRIYLEPEGARLLVKMMGLN